MEKQIVGYHLIFPYLSKLLPDSNEQDRNTPVINEKEYFKSLKETSFKINF